MTLRRVVTALLKLVAAALAFTTFATALLDVSMAWDVWYYHLPFAARLWNIVPKDAYVFHPTNQARFTGYPLLAEGLQGLLWRLTGRPESGNLVAFFSLVLFAWFLKRSFRVPWHLSALALSAIPLVHTHAVASYIDLPANLALAALILSVLRLYTTDAPTDTTDASADAARTPLPEAPWTVLALAAVVINMRFQLQPLALLAIVAAIPRLLVPVLRALRGPSRALARTRLALILLSIPVVFAWPLKNLVVHRNPYYPMTLSIFGLTLPGIEEGYASAPSYLAHAPRALRFAYSILEVGLPPITDERRWTIDQWAPNDSPALRMGGFFGAYVVFHLAILAWTTFRDRSRAVRLVTATFAALTLVTAHLPQSHELRYYLFWMILLVSLNLILASRDRVTAGLSRLALGVVCAAALGVVIASTHTWYVYPWGPTFAELLRTKVDPVLVRRVGETGSACIAREPWTFLYAPTFHLPARYSIREAETRADCGASPFVN